MLIEIKAKWVVCFTEAHSLKKFVNTFSYFFKTFSTKNQNFSLGIKTI